MALLLSEIKFNNNCWSCTVFSDEKCKHQCKAKAEHKQPGQVAVTIIMVFMTFRLMHIAKIAKTSNPTLFGFVAVTENLFTQAKRRSSFSQTKSFEITNEKCGKWHGNSATTETG